MSNFTFELFADNKGITLKIKYEIKLWPDVGIVSHNILFPKGTDMTPALKFIQMTQNINNIDLVFPSSDIKTTFTFIDGFIHLCIKNKNTYYQAKMNKEESIKFINVLTTFIKLVNS